MNISGKEVAVIVQALKVAHEVIMLKTLNLQIEINSVEHLKDKSCYNHNFYKIVANHPWWSLQGNDIVEEICHEDKNYFSFSLGHFDQNEEFVSVFEWESGSDCNGIQNYIQED